MRKFTGLFIIIISIAIIAFDCWYTHFYMIAFGRGLPEASFYQRVIATLFTSVPFLVCIYLALQHLIFESKRDKELLDRSKWSPLLIAGVFIGFSVFWYFISNIAIGAYFMATQRGSEVVCKKMVIDAQSTAAAISSYFSHPEHTTLPSLDQLREEEGLITDFPVTIDKGPDGKPTITVIDENGECPDGKKYVLYYYGIESEWKD
ncbi:MAG: hypothetical protein PVJ41_04195 [Desulfobacterales bacterium]|jgi:hypothetical protein